MTKLLEKAFKEASRLTEKEQNTFAKWLLEELVTEKKWEKLFTKSEDVLSKLADEALEEDAEGKTKKLNLENL